MTTPSTHLRQTVLCQARHVVAKIGTQLLARPEKGATGLDLGFFKRMAGQVAALRERGVRVTLVSSGAIGCGMVELGLAKRPADVADQQAVAAIGQRRLMTHYHEAFAPHGLKVAQLLLTRGDFDDRIRFLNIRNCVARLQAMDCVPIINENDTVAVDELRFGDNDLLAALMCAAIHADALVLLTSVDGLLDGAGRRMDLVENVFDAARLVRAERSVMGTGGMSSKLEAARIAIEAGEVAVIADGRGPDILVKLLDARSTEGLGTVFAPARKKLGGRERWIGLAKRPAGTVTIDAGAVNALAERGKSLLASGITAATGAFDRGELLLVRDPAGREVARGLSNYSADELKLIIGKKSSQFQRIFGRPAYAEVIHRDNMVVVGA